MISVTMGAKRLRSTRIPPVGAKADRLVSHASLSRAATTNRGVYRPTCPSPETRTVSHRRFVAVEPRQGEELPQLFEDWPLPEEDTAQRPTPAKRCRHPALTSMQPMQVRTEGPPFHENADVYGNTAVYLVPFVLQSHQTDAAVLPATDVGAARPDAPASVTDTSQFFTLMGH